MILMRGARGSYRGRTTIRPRSVRSQLTMILPKLIQGTRFDQSKEEKS